MRFIRVRQPIAHSLTEDTPETAVLSVPRNFAWALSGNLVLVLCQWGILTVLAQLGSPAMVGDYSWGLALTAPLIILSSLALRDVLVTDAAETFYLETFWFLRLASGIAVLLVLGIILIWFVPDEVPSVLTLIIGLAKVFELFSDLAYGQFQKNERMDIISRSMMMRGVGSLLIFSLILHQTASLLSAVVGTAFVSLGVLLVFDIPMVLKTTPPHRPSPNPFTLYRNVRRLSKTALPLGLAASLISFSANIPRYGLGTFAGSYYLGIYTVLAYPLTAGNIVVSAVAGVSLPRLTKHLSEGNKSRYFHIVRQLCILAGGLAICAIIVVTLLGEPALNLLFGPEYADEYVVFQILVVGMGIGFFNWFLNSALTAARMYRWSLGFEVANLILTFVLAWTLIPKYGLVGAAWANVCVMVVSVTLKSIVIWFARGTLGAKGVGA